MLTKIMKNELICTSRILGPLYLVFLLCTFVGKVEKSVELFDFHNPVSDFVRDVLTALYGSFLFATFLFTCIYLIVRFYKSMFGTEGYLTFTLPVKTTTILNGKILIGLLWLLINGLLIFLSIVLLALTPANLTAIVGSLDHVREAVLNAGYSLPSFLFWGIVLTASSAICSMMIVIVSFSIGQLANSHRIMLSSLAFIGIMILLQTIDNLINLNQFSNRAFLSGNITLSFSAPLSIELAVVLNIVLTIVFYLVSNRLLSKHLNLQ